MSDPSITLPLKFGLSIVAASVAETVTYPLDITKTRLQIQGELMSNHSKTQYRGMFRTMFGIVSEEGLFSLWNGLLPAVYRHWVYSGCRMTFYEMIRENILGRSKDGSYPLWKSVIGGATAGAAGQFVASPTDLLKVRMQAEGKRRLQGLSPRFTGVTDAFRQIWRQGGIKGLWKGWGPNVQRAALVNMGDLTTYDIAKHAILKHTNLKDNYVTHSLASAASGVVAALVGTPADVVKTRVMNQALDKNGRGLVYSSSFDCLVQSVKVEGFFALYKGLFPTWLRMAPWSLTFWLTFEQVRKTLNVSSF